MTVAIKAENISKQYRLGEVGTGTLSHDLHRAWAKLRGKPDPFAKVGEVNDREQVGGEYAWALRDISFDVEQGEILGIIGRNGAGKSTLLKILSRVTAPTSGKIKTRGRIASLLEVGTGFHPELTGRENVYLNGAIMGMTRSEITRRMEEIVEFSGCAKYIDTPVKRYSSGMTVRLGFAVAAHLDCETLIVDEVLAVGDAEFQRKCLSKMQDVASQGRTVIFVSHNMPSISRLTNRCIVISHGNVALDSTTYDAVSYYLNNQRKQVLPNDDVSGMPRLPFGTGDATIRKLCISDSSGVAKMGAAIGIRITCRSVRDLKRVQFHMTVFSSDGVPVGTSCSRDHIHLLPDRDTAVNLSLPNPALAPGPYYLDMTLLSGDRYDNQEIYDVLPNALSFEVSAILDDKGRVANWNKAWGCIVLPDLELMAHESR
jgi:lipopolysaccharide transport system ATP-binding protein